MSFNICSRRLCPLRLHRASSSFLKSSNYLSYESQSAFCNDTSRRYFVSQPPWNCSKLGHRQTSLKRYLHTSPKCLAPDPYVMLGLSRDASANDIKLKYRELAKQHHPDLNPGPDAAAKMASISAAYQLLSDPKQRQFYDQTGMSPEESGINTDGSGGNPFQGFGNADASFMFTDFSSFFTNAFGGARPGGHVHKGEDVETEVTLDFIEAAKGCQKAVNLNTNSSCEDCHGTGCAPGTSMSTCRSCSGTGTQKVERGPIVFGTVCVRCNGSGQVVTRPCKSCKGSGTRTQPRAIDLDFPAGVRSGMELRLSGQGHAGVRGGRMGDLFVKVNVRPHPQFKLIHDEIHVTVPLTLKQCLLGGDVNVPTLDGQLNLLVAPGTMPGDVKILRGKGIKKLDERGYGDLAIHWGLSTPKKLTDRQKEIIMEFDRIQFDTTASQPDKSEAKETEPHKTPPPPKPPGHRYEVREKRDQTIKDTSSQSSYNNVSQSSQSSNSKSPFKSRRQSFDKSYTQDSAPDYNNNNNNSSSVNNPDHHPRHDSEKNPSHNNRNKNGKNNENKKRSMIASWFDKKLNNEHQQNSLSR